MNLEIQESIVNILHYDTRIGICRIINVGAGTEEGNSRGPRTAFDNDTWQWQEPWPSERSSDQSQMHREMTGSAPHGGTIEFGSKRKKSQHVIIEAPEIFVRRTYCPERQAGAHPHDVKRFRNLWTNENSTGQWTEEIRSDTCWPGTGKMTRGWLASGGDVIGGIGRSADGACQIPPRDSISSESYYILKAQDKAQAQYKAQLS